MEDRTALLAALDQVLAAPAPPPADVAARLDRDIQAWLHEARTFAATARRLLTEAQAAVSAALHDGLRPADHDAARYARAVAQERAAALACDTATRDEQAARQARCRWWAARKRWARQAASAAIAQRDAARTAQRAAQARGQAAALVTARQRQNMLTVAAQALQAVSGPFGRPR